ncbi:DUF4097 family beta strand repeat-containing protein [Paenibacillus sp. OAS669]|uniref:DUF4097 family beta strand repeat-containing protein n=1 Tax=Paenibacillus sp. OAS669 TaxID=2663821 RepID=UPI00178BE654|nr:DUF4097 family beta strand repeat-containing protein [Paenibacillus sp. OAS669]MBE1440873.1 hypothetical protein [Paenibacillus sp. OAS669]
MKGKKQVGMALLGIGLILLISAVPKEGITWKPNEAAVGGGSLPQTIGVHASGMNVRIVTEERDDVLAVMEGSGALHTGTVGQTVEISAERGRFALFPLRSTLVVHLPSAYRNRLSVNYDEGDFAFEVPKEAEGAGLSLAELTIQARTGQAKLAGVHANRLQYTATSGSFRAESVVAGSASIELQTGDVQLDTFAGKLSVVLKQAGELSAAHMTVNGGDFNVRSGEVRLEQYSGPLRAEMQSGELVADFRELTGPAYARVGNGRAEVHLPAPADARIEAKVERGNVDSRYPFENIDKRSEKELLASSGEGRIPINMEVSAGEITIK